MSDSLWPHGLYSPWNSPGQNMGVGSHSLLQGIFPTQRLNPSLSHCRHILCQLSNKGSPIWHLYILYVTFIHIWQIPMWNIWHLGIILKKKIKIICKSKSDYSKHFSVYLLSMCLCVPPNIRVFSSESTLHMRWPKYWSFSLSISPSNEYPGLVSFRMDWLDLLSGMT